MRTTSLLLAALLCLAPASAAVAKKPASDAKPTASSENPSETPSETIAISGRVVVGSDKVFIKDAQGYIQVQGLDLAPFAGRNIQAKGIVIRKDQEYRIVRLLEYRIQSPDDDSPGAGGAVKQAKDSGGKKKGPGRDFRARGTPKPPFEAGNQGRKQVGA